MVSKKKNLLFVSFILDRMYIFPCEWNYRVKFCSKHIEERCLEAEENGARLVHGTRHVFDKEVKTMWQVIHKAFEKVSSSLVYFSMNTTVLPAKSDSDVMFCLHSYQGLRTDISLRRIGLIHE